MNPPVGVVLAGGASSRMGTDKALVEVDGRPMALLVADALRGGGCDPVWCQGGDATGLAAHGLTVRPDPHGRRGPVRAIADALAGVDVTAVVAACDLPCLDAATVAALVRLADERGAAAVAVADGRRHLLAAWPPGSAALLAAAIRDGVHSFRDALELVGAVELDVDPAVVRNVNRPGDVPTRR